MFILEYLVTTITVALIINYECHRLKEVSDQKYYIFKSVCTIAGARRDEDGYLWVTGRVDDMLNVSGHLMSTAEVESVLTEHVSVSEAAVVSRPHPVKGECLYCFITPNQGVIFTDKMVAELKTKGVF